MLPKATPNAAPKASGARAAGVVDQITFARKPGEPEKPDRLLRRVTGGGIRQGATGGAALWAVGWRIGA
jgi:hypothetical protein